MTRSYPEQITALLRKWGDGDERALDELTPLVYAHLRSVAAGLLRSESPGHLLQPTALVHEAYLRLAPHADAWWENRTHFFAIASRIMRNILVDYARQHQRQKRGGDLAKVPLEDALVSAPNRPAELLALDEALKRLALKYPRKCRIVEMHTFGGLTFPETAKILGVSLNTVQRDWNFAKAWLHRELEGQNNGSNSQL